MDGYLALSSFLENAEAPVEIVRTIQVGKGKNSMNRAMQLPSAGPVFMTLECVVILRYAMTGWRKAAAASRRW